MYLTGVMHNNDFSDLVEGHEHCKGKSLVEKDEFILIDLPCSVHRVRKDDNSRHD